jgi:hypothetical protein
VVREITVIKKFKIDDFLDEAESPKNTLEFSIQFLMLSLNLSQSSLGDGSL